MDVPQRDVFRMTDGETPGRLDAVSRRFWVVGFSRFTLLPGFRDEERVAPALFTDIIQCQTASELHLQILDGDMVHGMIFDTGYQTSIAAIGILDIDIADADVVDGGAMESCRSPHAVAQSYINR